MTLIDALTEDGSLVTRDRTLLELALTGPSSSIVRRADVGLASVNCPIWSTNNGRALLGAVSYGWSVNDRCRRASKVVGKTGEGPLWQA